MAGSSTTSNKSSDRLNSGIAQAKLRLKRDFADRLRRLAREKGWHQSELARQAGLTRDSVSVYMRGSSLPTGANLQKLATALGISADELIPHSKISSNDEAALFEIKVSPEAPNKARLYVDHIVSLAAALKIASILQEEGLVDPSDSTASPAAKVDSIGN